MTRVAPVLVPIALVALFLGTFRRTGYEASAGAVDHDPASAAQLTDLGDGQVRDGRVDLAEHTYRQALELDSRDGDLHARLGEPLLKRGDRAGAAAEGQSALRWHPGSARALALVARSGSAAVAVSDQ